MSVFVNEIANYLIKFILFFDCFFCNQMSLLKRRVFTKETSHIGHHKCIARDETSKKEKKEKRTALQYNGFGADNSTNTILKFEYYSLRQTLNNDVIITLLNDIFIEIIEFQQSIF